MTMLIIGFDSAWSRKNHGAIVAVLKQDDDSFKFLGIPQRANFDKATKLIDEWIYNNHPSITLILIDQPVIVKNMDGQRDVENIVSSSVSLRYGGMQPANRKKEAMFGDGAPIWEFLNKHGNSNYPVRFIQSQSGVWIIETYPVLTLIALKWLLVDDHKFSRKTGKLPKYNPDRKTFTLSDWKFVCDKTAEAINEFGLQELVKWLKGASVENKVTKQLQDGLDACLCLLVGLYWFKDNSCLMVGNLESPSPGYIVVPNSQNNQYLLEELDERCKDTGRLEADWIHKLNF
jgi:predicted RNase H-like nuclease